jgi:uncharacterized protein YndB with AHSA1/START domain
MFEFTVATEIACPPQRVWDFLVDVRRWWLRSNPEHERLEILGPRGAIALGTELRIRERIAGIPGEAAGRITEFVPGERATWQAQARYRLLGARVAVEEGVTWSLARSGDGTRLSAHVWARFPDGAAARLIEWGFVHLLRGRERDRRHAQIELDYVRGALERPADPF